MLCLTVNLFGVFTKIIQNKPQKIAKPGNVQTNRMCRRMMPSKYCLSQTCAQRHLTSPVYLKSKERGSTAIGWRVLVPGARHRLVTCERGAKVKRCLDTVSYLVDTDNHISADHYTPHCANREIIVYISWLSSAGDGNEEWAGAAFNSNLLMG